MSVKLEEAGTSTISVDTLCAAIAETVQATRLLAKMMQ
jgi:hypothetical protein